MYAEWRKRIRRIDEKGKNKKKKGKKEREEKVEIVLKHNLLESH